MGSKKLKAVVLAGARPLPCHDPEKVKALSKELGEKLLKMTLPTGLGVFIGAGGCYYGQMMGVHMWKLVEYLNAAEGWHCDGDHYMEIGERIQTLRQLFNIKQGVDPASVKLPRRMLGDPPLPSGPLKGVTLRNREQVSAHWAAFGWDAVTGVPLPETVERLGIGALMEVKL